MRAPTCARCHRFIEPMNRSRDLYFRTEEKVLICNRRIEYNKFILIISNSKCWCDGMWWHVHIPLHALHGCFINNMYFQSVFTFTNYRIWTIGSHAVENELSTSSIVLWKWKNLNWKSMIEHVGNQKHFQKC